MGWLLQFHLLMQPQRRKRFSHLCVVVEFDVPGLARQGCAHTLPRKGVCELHTVTVAKAHRRYRRKFSFVSIAGDLVVREIRHDERTSEMELSKGSLTPEIVAGMMCQVCQVKASVNAV